MYILADPDNKKPLNPFPFLNTNGNIKFKEKEECS